MSDVVHNTRPKKICRLMIVSVDKHKTIDEYDTDELLDWDEHEPCNECLGEVIITDYE